MLLSVFKNGLFGLTLEYRFGTVTSLYRVPVEQHHIVDRVMFTVFRDHYDSDDIMAVQYDVFRLAEPILQKVFYNQAFQKHTEVSNDYGKLLLRSL